MFRTLMMCLSGHIVWIAIVSVICQVFLLAFIQVGSFVTLASSSISTRVTTAVVLIPPSVILTLIQTEIAKRLATEVLPRFGEGLAKNVVSDFVRMHQEHVMRT